MDQVTQATADAQMEKVHYRIVSDGEVLHMKPIFDKLNWPTPDPEMAKVVVAQAGIGDKGVVLGFAVVQFIPHAEPFWVHPSVRGMGVAEDLMRETMHYIENDCHIKRYVVTAKNGAFSARLAEMAGMTPLHDVCVYVKNLP